MSTDLNQHDQHDDALNKILAALRDAAPPQGMEARIAQRLQQHATAPSAPAFRWRDAFANFARTGEWWRGAVTGAAAVLLITVAFQPVTHLLSVRPDRRSTAASSTAAKSVASGSASAAHPPFGLPTNQDVASPCGRPAMQRASSIVPFRPAETLRGESLRDIEALSHPAPPLPVTAQERALIRLAQTADPKQLATLNPEEHAKLEAQDAAAFAKFFAPRTPLSTEGDAPTNPVEAPQTNPQSNSNQIPQ